jgi:hypothetical protein
MRHAVDPPQTAAPKSSWSATPRPPLRPGNLWPTSADSF